MNKQQKDGITKALRQALAKLRNASYGEFDERTVAACWTASERVRKAMDDISDLETGEGGT